MPHRSVKFGLDRGNKSFRFIKEPTDLGQRNYPASSTQTHLEVVHSDSTADREADNIVISQKVSQSNAACHRPAAAKT